MSTEQADSRDTIEEARREIRGLVGEIARLARTEMEPGEFWGEFLGRVVSAMAAVGGAVWTVEDGGRLALQGQANLGQTGIAQQDEEDQARHSRLLQKAFADGQGLLVPPQSAPAVGPQAGNPTGYLLVLAPLKPDLEVVGVLEIFQRADTRPEAQRGYLRFALQMCELAGDFFRLRQLRSLSDRQALWSQLEEFTRAVHATLEVGPTAYTVANEGRRLIGCDRLSVAVRRGRHCAIEAVSGQDIFEKRSNTVRLLGKLADMVAGAREAVWYTGDTSQMAPQVEQVIQEYVDQAQSKAVGVLPLVQPRPFATASPYASEGSGGDEQDLEHDDGQQVEQVVGVLIVERIEDSRISESMRGRIDFVCRHSSSALANAWEHQNLFLMPVWKALGKARWLVRARNLPKTTLAAGAALVLLAWLIFWPASFEMEASGTLEPVRRRKVFAGLDGRVEQVFVDHGQRVHHHPILGTPGCSVPGPIWAEFQRDPQRQGDDPTLLVIPQGNGLLDQSGVQPGDTVRLSLPGRADDQPERADLVVRQVVDGSTLRLESGLAGRPAGPVRMEIWRITPLVRLRSTKLEMDLASVIGRQKTVREQILTTQRLLLEEADLTVEQQNRLSGQLAELEQEARSLQNKLRLHRQKQKDLLVTAPSEGQVVTWEVRDRLSRRPVRRGQVLMEVADPEGPWQLELRMAEDQVGYILERQRELDEPLKVTYIAATDPGTERTGRVVEIHQSAEVRGEEGNTVLIKVAPDDDFGAAKDRRLLAARRPGAELTARVHCGKRPIGYVLFHDLIAFIRSRILFRL